MTVKTVELRGERFVIPAEADFLKLQNESNTPGRDGATLATPPCFPDVTPIDVGGIAASTLLLQDRR